jgi:hypothetical protein
MKVAMGGDGRYFDLHSVGLLNRKPYISANELAADFAKRPNQMRNLLIGFEP